MNLVSRNGKIILFFHRQTNQKIEGVGTCKRVVRFGLSNQATLLTFSSKERTSMPLLTPEDIAFPKLSEQQMKVIANLGRLKNYADGENLINVGEKDYPFCIVASGEVRIVDSSSETINDVVTHGPREFIGDVDVLTGRPAVISAIAKGETQAYVLTAAEARRLLNEIPGLGELLLEAFQMRRKMLQASAFRGVLIVGETHDRSTSRIREFLYKNHVPHTYFDVDDESGIEQLRKLGQNREDTPLVACNGTIVTKPSIASIAECLGISREVDVEVYDLIIVGAGPAGLAASVYAGSEGIKTLVIDRVGPGGQAGSSSKIENFIGFPSGLSGAELANRGYLQALKFGVQFTAPVSVRSIRQDANGNHLLELCTGQFAKARCVLAATGVTYRQLNIAGCTEFEGVGVYYSATSVEARVCNGSTAIVVGGGNSAGQAAMYLSEHADQVKVLIRGGDLGQSMSSYLSERVCNHKKIEVLPYTELAAIHGNERVSMVEIIDNRDQQKRTIDCTAAFIFIGARPHTDWLPPSVARDEKGFVLTGSLVQSAGYWSLDRMPCDLETSIPGILAAGDVRSGTTKRCGFAVGDGATAIACVHRFLDQLH